jgi:hypothetical protein
MANFLRKEYIYDDGYLMDADSDIDKGHEEHVIDAICRMYAYDFAEIAEEILDKKFNREDLSGDENKIKMEIEDYINQIKEYGEGQEPGAIYGIYKIIRSIEPRLVSNPKLQEAMNALYGDSRMFGCKHLGYIIIRGNNFEVWRLDPGTSKKIVDAVHEIANQDGYGVSDDEISEQEINVYSYETEKSRTYTVGELQGGGLLKTASIPSTKANVYIPPLKKKQSFTTKRLGGMPQSMYHSMVSTSEWLSFKEWISRFE